MMVTLGFNELIFDFDFDLNTDFSSSISLFVIKFKYVSLTISGAWRRPRTTEKLISRLVLMQFVDLQKGLHYNSLMMILDFQYIFEACTYN